MKFTKNILASAVLLASSSVAMAAFDTTDIEINVTKDPFVNFIGSLSGNTTVALLEADVNGTTTTLGTLGTETNFGGACSLGITSTNDFELLLPPAAGSTPLHGGAKYDVDFAGENFDTAGGTTGTNTVLLTSCNNPITNFDMNSPAITGVVAAGTYSDTLRATVTTQ